MRNIFLVLMYRDFLVFLQNWRRLLINFGFISPFIFAISWGYIVPYVGIESADPTKAVLFFAGSILWALIPLSFSLHTQLLLDLEYDNFILYQCSIAPPRLVLFERVFFASVIIFCYATLFFPVAWLVLQDRLDMSQVSWPLLLVMLYMGALFTSTFTIFQISYSSGVRSVRNFFMRCYYPLVQLGGLFFSWRVMHTFSPVCAYVILFNPFLYITEGVKRALLNDQHYFSIWICVAALSCFTVFFMQLGWYYFKKKVDHI